MSLLMLLQNSVTLTNFALTSTATASSVSTDGVGAGAWGAERAIDGYRHTNNRWNSLTPGGGGWQSDTIGAGQWLEINFNALKPIQKINVFTIADAANYTTEPTLSDTFSSFGIVDFTVEYWNGSSWVVISTVTGNDKVWREFNFSPILTEKIRINVTSALTNVARIIEVEAWGVPPFNYNLVANNTSFGLSGQVNSVKFNRLVPAAKRDYNINAQTSNLSIGKNLPVTKGDYALTGIGASSSLLTNLVSYWKLDEAGGTALDALGINDLPMFGTPVATTGKVGTGRDYVLNSGGFGHRKTEFSLSATNGISVSLWLKPTSFPHYGNLFTVGSPFLAGNFQVHYYFGNLTMQLASASSYAGYYMENPLSLGVWQHCVFILRPDGVVKFYLNGVEVNITFGTAKPLTTVEGVLQLGGNDGGSSSLDGVLDDVKLHSRVLTQAEITEDYNRGSLGNPLPLNAGTTNLNWNRLIPASQRSYNLTGNVSSLKKQWVLGQSFFGSVRTLTGFDVNLRKGFSLQGNKADFSLSGQANVLQGFRILTAPNANFNLTGQNIVMLKGRTMAAVLRNYNLNGQTNVLRRGLILNAATRDYNLTGQNNAFQRMLKLVASAGNYTLSGQNTGLLKASRMVATLRSYTLTGNASNLSRARIMQGNLGSYSMAGNQSVLKQGYALVGQRGDYLFTFPQITAGSQRVLQSEKGEFALSEADVILLRSYILSGAKGDFTFNGLENVLKVARQLFTAKADFTLTGVNTPLTRSYILVTDEGNFLVSGQSSDFEVSRTLIAESGNFSIIPISNSLYRALILSVSGTTYVLTGQANTLTKSVYTINLLPPFDVSIVGNSSLESLYYGDGDILAEVVAVGDYESLVEGYETDSVIIDMAELESIFGDSTELDTLMSGSEAFSDLIGNE